MGRRFKAFKRWTKETFSDVDGESSSKRLMTFITLIAVLITWWMNLFYQSSINEYIFEGLIFIVLSGMGAATVEKFSRSRYRRFKNDRYDEPPYGPDGVDPDVENPDDEVYPEEDRV